MSMVRENKYQKRYRFLMVARLTINRSTEFIHEPHWPAYTHHILNTRRCKSIQPSKSRRSLLERDTFTEELVPLPIGLKMWS